MEAEELRLSNPDLGCGRQAEANIGFSDRQRHGAVVIARLHRHKSAWEQALMVEEFQQLAIAFIHALHQVFLALFGLVQKAHAMFASFEIAANGQSVAMRASVLVAEFGNK